MAICLLALAGGGNSAVGAPFDFLFGDAPADRAAPRARRRAPRPPQVTQIPLPPPRPHFPGDPPPAPDVASPGPAPANPAASATPPAKTAAKPATVEPADKPDMPTKAAGTGTPDSKPPAREPVTAAPAPGSTPPLPPPKPAEIATTSPRGQEPGSEPETSRPVDKAVEAAAPEVATSSQPSSSTAPMAAGSAPPPLPPAKPAELATPSKPEGGAPADVSPSGPATKAMPARPPAPSAAGPLPPAPPPTPPLKPPEVAKPETAKPETAKPDTARPDTAKPGEKPAAPAVAPSGATTAFTPRSPEDNPQCPVALAARHVEAAPISIGPQPDPRCTVVEPVRLTRLTLADGQTVEFPETPTIACTTADSFSAFVRDLLVPLAKGTFGAPVTAVWTGPGLECRSRDHIFGAKLSAHGQGLAIDIARLKLADGRIIEVGTPKTDAETGFETAARAGACGYFHTVLGPGSDSYHRTHWHFDLEVRGAHGDSKYCK